MLINTSTNAEQYIRFALRYSFQSPIKDTSDHSQTAFQIYATLRTNRLHQVVRQCEGDLC